MTLSDWIKLTGQTLIAPIILFFGGKMLAWMEERRKKEKADAIAAAEKEERLQTTVGEFGGKLQQLVSNSNTQTEAFVKLVERVDNIDKTVTHFGNRLEKVEQIVLK